MDSISPGTSPPSPAGEDDSPFQVDDSVCERLVHGILYADASVIAQLHAMLSPGILFLLARTLPNDALPEKVHCVLRATVRRIREGELDKPNNLLRLIRVVVREHIAMYLDVAKGESLWKDAIETAAPPASETPSGDQVAPLCQVLQQLSGAERDALSRFYVLGQTEDQILDATGFSPARLRSLKAGVKSSLLALRGQAPVTRTSRRVR